MVELVIVSIGGGEGKRVGGLTWSRLVKSEFGADSGERAMAATGGWGWKGSSVSA